MPFADEITTDWKPRRRVRDPELLRELHVLWRGECVLWELGECVDHYSLHHIHGHPRDDLRANLVMLCGSGTTGHHGQITVNQRDALAALGVYIVNQRPDTLTYLAEKLGGEQQSRQWLRNRLYAPVR